MKVRLICPHCGRLYLRPSLRTDAKDSHAIRITEKLQLFSIRQTSLHTSISCDMPWKEAEFHSGSVDELLGCARVCVCDGSKNAQYRMWESADKQEVLTCVSLTTRLMHYSASRHMVCEREEQSQKGAGRFVTVVCSSGILGVSCKFLDR